MTDRPYEPADKPSTESFRSKLRSFDKARLIPVGDKTRGIFLMILASFFFSIMGAFVKKLTHTFPSFEVVFFRSVSMLLIVSPWMLAKKIPFIGDQKGIMLIRALSGVTALCLSFYIVTKMELANASILDRTSVIFVALLSVLFLKEKMTVRLFIYTALALFGAALIIKPNWHIADIPGLAGLGAGFFAAVAYVSVKKLHETDHYMTMVFYLAFFGSLISLVASLPHWVSPSPIEWGMLLLMGTIATIAQILLTYSYKLAPASIVTPYSFSSVSFSGLWGFFFWGEIPDFYSLCGGLLLVACGIGIMRLKH